MRLLTIFCLFLLSAGVLQAQGKYFTKKGKVSFLSKTPLEDISAETKTAACVLDSESGDLVLRLLIKGFHFEKALMQEHFNENYMESSKYPKAIFKGKVLNIKDVDLTNDGEYDITLSGTFDIHGIMNKEEVEGKITVAGGKITGTSSFVIAPGDYNIKIPSVVKENIAKEITVNVQLELEELKK